MLQEDAGLAEAVGARGAQVVLVEHVEESGAGHARDHGQRDHAEDHRGEDQVAQGVGEHAPLARDGRVHDEHAGGHGRRRQPDGETSAGGQEVELPVEDEHGHQPEPEDRHGAEEHRGGRDEPVRPAAAPRRRDDTERDADEGAVLEVVDHGPPVDDGVAEVAAGDVAHVVEVADPQRPVEAEACPGGGDHLGGRVSAPGGHERRVAGQVLGEREHRGGDGSEQRHQERQASEDEQHVRGARPRGSADRGRRAPARPAR